MNGTSDGYNHEISSPGWGFGDTHALRSDQMGIAQISPWLLIPPDGLTFQDGTCGEMFGYAWMALPLVEAKPTTADLPVPTGDQSWSLFINSRNFKGPVAFYTPSTWSRVSRRHAPAAGRGLDARPGLVTGGAIEINTVPRFVADDDQGTTFTRIPRLQFPADEQGRTILMHNLTHYSKGALYDQVAAWIAGGDAPSGEFSMNAAIVPHCKARPLKVKQAGKWIRDCQKWVETTTLDATTFGLQWRPEVLEPWIGTMRRGSFPEYFQKKDNEFVAVAADAAPAETKLREAHFLPALTDQAYTSPVDGENNAWTVPGPRAGPFQAKLGDGSVVTYSWYRFIDQPALQDADLTDAAKARLQSLVEKMHTQWTRDKEYLPPPGLGTLATLDSSLIVTPPPGLEVGFVPIVTRQSSR